MGWGARTVGSYFNSTEFPYTQHSISPIFSILHLLQLINQYSYIIINQRPQFILLSSVFLMSFFCSRIPSRIPHYIKFLCLLRLFLALTVSQTFLIFKGFWGGLVRHFTECPSNEICPLFFSWLDWGYGFWGGFPGGASGEDHTCQYRRCKRHWFDPWVGKFPWRRVWQPIPVFLPGESHGQRSLLGDHP